MADFKRIREVMDAAYPQLLMIPGVHAVAIGPKVVAGQRTAVPAIIVYLVEKRAADQVSSRDLIPATIDGVPTDVVQSPIPVQHVVEDEQRYTPLLGGVQTQGGDNYSVGTLGFIGALNEPIPRIVGVTNWHVAGIPSGEKTRLQANISADQKSITFVSPTPKIRPSGAYVRINLRIFPDASNPPRSYDFLAQASGEDTVSDLATAVAATINGFADPALTATASGGVVTLIPIAGAIVTQQGADLPNHDQYHQTFGLQGNSPNSRLRAKIARDTISIDGVVDGDDYGIFTTLHPLRGFVPSVGIYIGLTKAQSLSSVATQLASALGGLGGGVTATATGTQVKIGGAFAIECVTWRDVRMGQPDNDFGCCCSHRIGRTILARQDVDVALIQLDPDLEYLAEVTEIGPLSGQHVVTDDEVMAGFTVQKRGRTTLRTDGTVTSIHRLGFIQANIGSTNAFVYGLRRYTEAMTIASVNSSPFSDQGDSGSAIVHSAGGQNDVVGVLFGGPPEGQAGDTVATNIAPIVTAFNLVVKTAAAAGQVQTVPKLTTASVGSAASAAPARIDAAGWKRMREVESELSVTPNGRSYVTAVRRHFREASRLVNKNRRVGVAWQRNGGPILLNAVLRCVQDDKFTIPTQLAGRALAECWACIRSALRDHGSVELIAALDELDLSGDELGGKTYEDILSWLREREERRQRELGSESEARRSPAELRASLEQQG
jgi:hypothetical protein